MFFWELILYYQAHKNVLKFSKWNFTLPTMAGYDILLVPLFKPIKPFKDSKNKNTLRVLQHTKLQYLSTETTITNQSKSHSVDNMHLLSRVQPQMFMAGKWTGTHISLIIPA